MRGTLLPWGSAMGRVGEEKQVREEGKKGKGLGQGGRARGVGGGEREGGQRREEWNSERSQNPFPMSSYPRGYGSS